MLTQYADIEALMQAVDQDKTNPSNGEFVADRYPIRFVLFDNFRDCYEFISRQTSNSLSFQSIDFWLDKNFPDVIVTYSTLADKIFNYARECAFDTVITPFSELARFYNNKTSNEFDSLIATIKGAENSKQNYIEHRRVYIPIVGLHGKMSKYANDPQCMMWYLKTPDHQLNYNLVLTNNTTYNVKGLDKKATLVHNAMEWLQIWKEQDIKHTIICTSQSIFVNAEYAQPDNAFDYTVCHNVYEFLTKGLGLSLNLVEYKPEDEQFWLRLAGEIDIHNFNFNAFFNAKFGIYDLADHKVFYQTWFKSHDAYSRWLLSAYYTNKFCDQGYICRTLKNCSTYNNSEFVQNLLLTIFDLEDQADNLDERNEGLRQAQSQNIVLPDEVQELLESKLKETEERLGTKSALRYVTSTTDVERRLVIQWLRDGTISPTEIAEVYPDLYAYMKPTFGTQEADKIWCLSYIDAYKRAKLADVYTDEIKNLLLSKNANEISFNNWYNRFKTVRNIMCNRNDIHVYFWIDGLGMEWIPFIKQVVDARNDEDYYLNDVLIARSIIPTATEINKYDLQKLSGGTLPKNGDLDSDSHKSRPYPSYIIADMKKIREAINRILDENPGKKIAIISDHGISYLSQLVPGLNLNGITGDHSGRFATWNKGTAVSDEKYKILDDQRTICALRHESLTSKVDANCGCHGGCTPEEVLVPIFIISNSNFHSTTSITPKTLELSASNPVVRFKVSGLSSADIPYLLYNGQRYEMHAEGGDNWCSAPLVIASNVDKVILVVQEMEHNYKIKINLGVVEDDLF